MLRDKNALFGLFAATIIALVLINKYISAGHPSFLLPVKEQSDGQFESENGSDTLEGYYVHEHMNKEHPKTFFGTKFWRKYCPEISSYLTAIENGKHDWPVELQSTTSPEFTTLKLEASNKNRYIVGEKLKAVIQSKDGYGLLKRHGGDYFHIRLVRYDEENRPTTDAVSTEVIDHQNGTYMLSVPLFWPGTIKILAELVHSSEALVNLVTMTTGFVGKGITFAGTYENGEKRECNVGLNYRKSAKEICNFSKPEKGISWYCYAPEKGGCTDLKWLETTKLLNTKSNFIYHKNWKAPIKGSGVALFVKPSDVLNDILKELPSCLPTLGFSSKAFDKLMGSHIGFYKDDRWRSLQCFNLDEKHLRRVQTCFKHKIIYLIGDSTLRQWYILLIKKLKMSELEKEDPVVWQKPRSAENRHFNITLLYRGHGSPLYGSGPPSSRPFVVNTLAGINHGNGENVYLVLNIAAHFCLFEPAVYMKRVAAIKNSVKSLIERSPKITILVRGCIRHKNSRTAMPTEWFSYRLCKILKGMFSDLSNIGFVDTWQLTSAHPPKHTHPDDVTVSEHIALFMSYVCPAH